MPKRKKATTSDIGLTIADRLAETVSLFDEEANEMGTVEVVDLQADDPNNPLIILANGQSFRIRIFASREEIHP